MLNSLKSGNRLRVDFCKKSTTNWNSKLITITTNFIWYIFNDRSRWSDLLGIEKVFKSIFNSWCSKPNYTWLFR